jgi:type IV pilus assembly protein PilQ
MPSLAAALLLTLAVTQAGSDGRPSGSELVTGEAPAAAHNLIDVRVDSGVPGRTDIVLAVDGEVAYESLVLDGPDRLVLDLQGVTSRLDRYKYPVDRSGVVRVRAAQHTRAPQPVTRVVFDLERPLAYTVDQRDSQLVVSFASGDEPPAAVAGPVAVPPPSDAETETTEVAALVQELESRFDETPTQPPPAADEAFGDSERRVEGDLIERLMRTPVLAAPAAPAGGGRAIPESFKTKTIVTEEVVYSGTEISLNLVDADVKQVFRLFHEISGLNFVLDPSVAGQVTVVLDHVPWDQALDIILKNNGLDKQLENNVIRIASTKKLAQEAAERKQLKEAKELEVEPITITRTLSYAKSKEVERVIRESGVLSNRGKVIVDERTNTLIISDIPKKVSPLDTLISTLDSETPQVMIEARIVETSRDFTRDLGVIWGFTAIADASKGTSTGLTFPHNAAVKYGLNLPGEGGASALAFKFGNVLDSFTLDVQLNTLESEGRGRVLSSPKIATQNNERAEIEQGVRIPIVNTTATEINVEFVSASLRMQVTPQITAEGTIILDVMVENNSPDFVNTAGDIPSIRTQRAQTKVLINDGGTTVIGGIFTINEGRSEVGVPWFRKLPVFGWLFKQQNITNQNRELLIFITPKIMRVS